MTRKPGTRSMLATGAAADVALVAKIACGDVRSLEELYRLWSPVLLGLAVRILRNREDAEDVLQDAIVDVWRNANGFDPARGTPLSWAASMVRSRALDRVRARGRAVRVAEKLQTAPPAAEPSSDADLDRPRILAALAGLPAEQRTVLDLAYFEGLTQREIAERSGHPLGTVKTRARTALRTLASLLGSA